ncbi:unnamed protein product [Lactuca saligna]|uniref:Dynamin stalk domain-containing protein n=1 Tax=Lactuca saligna TaxID=75948 RepID=A0AA35ZKP0_LACSI|nr:unnamed protein product [Lactuca saligna]
MVKVVKPFVNQVKEDLTQRVQETIEAEALTWYTSDQALFDSSKRLQQENLESFMTATRSNMSVFNLECHGMIQIDHLQDVAEDKRKNAFKLWMKFNRYIPVVTLRLVDGIAIYLRHLITKGVLKQMTDNFIKEMFIERDTLANWVPNTTKECSGGLNDDWG